MLSSLCLFPGQLHPSHLFSHFFPFFFPGIYASPLPATLKHRDATMPAFSKLPTPLKDAFQEAAYSVVVLDAFLSLFRLESHVIDCLTFQRLTDRVIAYHTYHIACLAAIAQQPDTSFPANPTYDSKSYFPLVDFAAYPRTIPPSSKGPYLIFWHHASPCHVAATPRSPPRVTHKYHTLAKPHISVAWPHFLPHFIILLFSLLNHLLHCHTPFCQPYLGPPRLDPKPP